MALPNRGRLTLRLQYWHQSSVGESAQHHALLHAFVKDYLALLVRSTRFSYPWDCQLVRLEPGSGPPRRLVPVQVNLVHRHYAHDNAQASSQCRDLWDKIKALTGNQEFRNLFGSPMIAVNICPVGLEDPWRKEYTFGMVVQNLAVEPNHIVHVAENTLDFLGDSAVLAADVLGLVGRYAAQALNVPSGVQRSAQEELVRVAQIAEGIGNTMRNTWDSYQDSRLNDKVALQRISEATVQARRLFDESYVSAVSRISRVCDSQNPSGEDVMEAIVAVRKMTLLYPGVADGSRNLVSCLRGRKKRTNAKVGAVAIVGGLAGLYAAGFFFGPAGLAASFLYSWVTAGAASGAALAVGGTVGGVAAVGGAGTLLVKIPWEGGRLENVQQKRQDFQKAATKLSFYSAACWLENIWKMKFADISDREREEYLRSLGVDPLYFGVKEYRLAQLRDSLKEFKLRHAEMKKCFDGLYKDLGVSTEIEYREPTT